MTYVFFHDLGWLVDGPMFFRVVEVTNQITKASEGLMIGIDNQQTNHHGRSISVHKPFLMVTYGKHVGVGILSI